MRFRIGLVATWVITVALGVNAQEKCALPGAVDSPQTLEQKLQKRPTDYMALVLSWSPEHCESQRLLLEKAADEEGRAKIRAKQGFQCFSDNRFEWVVHGLWPQYGQAKNGSDHPRHCEPSDGLPATLVRKHLCMMPGGALMQNEWQAHGTCGWPTADSYFDEIQKLYAVLKRPTAVQMLGSDASGSNRLVEVKVSRVKQSFYDLNPTLPTGSVRVNVASGNLLKEIWVCLSKDKKVMACPSDGAPDQLTVRARTPRR